MARQFTAASTQGFGADNVALLNSGASTVHSFASWVYIDSWGGVIMDIEALGQGWGIDFPSTGVVQVFTRGANSGNRTLANGTGTWFHIGAVYDQGNNVLRIYEDGAELYADTSYTDNSSVTNPEFGIGIAYRGGTNSAPFDGRMCEAAIWDVELDPNSYASLAGGVSPIRVERSSLLLYYPLFGRVSPEKDFSGNNLDLTAQGTPTQIDHAPVAPQFGFDESFVSVAAAPAGGRIMSSLVGAGGLAGVGGIAGKGGGLIA